MFAPAEKIWVRDSSRGMAVMRGRDFVTPDDVKIFAEEALSHRIILESEHLMEGVDAGEVVEDCVKRVEVPKEFEPR